MDSLQDIAGFIAISSSIVCEAVIFILQLSYLVGQTLVDVVLQLTNYFVNLWDTISLMLQIIYEDSLVFFMDAGEKCSFIFNFLFDTGAIISSTFLLGIVSVGTGVSNVGIFLWNLVNTISLFLCNTISFLHEGVVFARQILILLGSSIWLCITVIPFAVLYYFQILTQSIVSLINDIGTLSLISIKFVSDGLYDTAMFFFAIPLSSGYGLICGIALLLVVVKNFKKICVLISQGLHKLYCCLISCSSSLWSGRFLESRNLNGNIELYHENLISGADVKLCVVCQDNYREIITFPCKHLCLCKVCSVQICKNDKSCPICRKHVTKTVKVYMP